MLNEQLSQLVHKALGDDVLLDAKRGRGLLTTTARLEEQLKSLRNAGFSRFIDLCAQHLGVSSTGADEYALWLTLRCPTKAHAALTLKWGWPARPEPAAKPSPAPEPPEPEPSAKPPEDAELAALGVQRHEIRPPEETPAGNGDEVGGTSKRVIPTTRGSSAIDSGGDGDEIEHGQAEGEPPAEGYNDASGAGQSGGSQPQRTGPVPHPTLSRIWPAAGLCEREIFELAGLPFSGNENLTPLLLPMQFRGFPLRRDFELPAVEDYARELLKQREEQALLGLLKDITAEGPRFKQPQPTAFDEQLAQAVAPPDLPRLQVGPPEKPEQEIEDESQAGMPAPPAEPPAPPNEDEPRAEPPAPPAEPPGGAS